MTPLRLLWLSLCFLVPAPAQQYRAYWADAFNRGFKTPAQADQLIEDAVASGANAIILQVRQRGNSFYLNSLEPLAEDRAWSGQFDPLQYLIERARPRGLEVHAWFTISPIWLWPNRPRDPKHIFNLHGPNATGSDMWMTVGATGVVSPSYVDLGHPAASQHTADVILHLVRHYDVDGIHLDYIRYPEPAKRAGDYGYNPRALDRFHRLALEEGRPRSNDERWTGFRRQQVTQFVRQVYLRVNELKPQVKVSGALITWGPGPRTDAEYRQRSAYTSVFQDWRAWLEEGILDIAMPMNYFPEPRGRAYLDRWAEYEKDRQYGRMTLIGLGNYLSSIDASVAQLRRSLAPSRTGNQAGGVAFYSYANTNRQDTSGRPRQLNADFFRHVKAAWGDDARIPELPWKSRPERGHLLGRLTVEQSAEWMVDGVEVSIESGTRPGVVQTTSTDANGWFGAVDLQPDRYLVRLARNGREFHRSGTQEVRAGATARFDVRLSRADVAPALPQLEGAETAQVPANGVVRLEGARLDGRLQAMVNGVPATVFRSSADEAWLVLPNLDVPQWRITVRQPGVESNTLQLAAGAAAPEVVGVRRAGDVLQVFCVGLGRVSELTSRPVLPVEVTVNGLTRPLLFAGGSPGRALYQVNVTIPAAADSGTVQVRAGRAASAPFRWRQARQPNAAALRQARLGKLVLANLRRMSLDSFPRYQTLASPAGTQRAADGDAN